MEGKVLSSFSIFWNIPDIYCTLLHVCVSCSLLHAFLLLTPTLNHVLYRLQRAMTFVKRSILPHWLLSRIIKWNIYFKYFYKIKYFYFKVIYKMFFMNEIILCAVLWRVDAFRGLGLPAIASKHEKMFQLYD